MDDLANHILDTFPATNGKWAIGGNSMGGFGAVRLGLKYPHRFFFDLVAFWCISKSRYII